MIFFPLFLKIESKNQEVTEQETNSNNAKNDLSALQNHNLLIALAHGNSSGGSPFAMPVSYLLKLLFFVILILFF